MKRIISWVLALIMIMSLAACGSTGGTDQPANTQTGYSGKTEESKPTASANETQSGTPAGSAQTAADNLPTADKFLFRTSDEMRAFMQPYQPSEKIDWKEPYLRGWSEKGSVEGSLMPDKKNFEQVSFGCAYNSDVTQAKEALLAAYHEICEKTGLVFSGMEEHINGATSLEDIGSEPYEDGEYTLRLYSFSYNPPSLSLFREDGEYGAVPYTADDARAYMQGLSGRVFPRLRDVTGPDRDLWEETGEHPFGWEASLNQDDYLIDVTVDYYGTDAEEGKAFFKAFTEFFVTGDVREEGLRIISDSYDSLEAGKNESITIDRLYQVTLYRKDWGYSMNINIYSEAKIPSEAQQFPNAEEQAALRLDPFSRIGIDLDAEFPETVIFEQGSARIVLEKVYGVFILEPMFRIKIRMENVPDNMMIDMEVKEINGQSFDDYWEISWSSAGTFLNDNEQHEPVEIKTIQLYVDDLIEAYGLDQLNSLTFKGFCCEYEYDEEEGPKVINEVRFDDVTCEAAG